MKTTTKKCSEFWDCNSSWHLSSFQWGILTWNTCNLCYELGNSTNSTHKSRHCCTPDLTIAMANSGTAAKHIIKTFICFFASQYLMNDVCSWCVILHPFLWHTNSFPSLYNHVLCIKLDTLPTQPIPCMPTIFSEPPLPPPILYRPGPYTKMSCNNAELNLHVKAVFPPHQPLSLTRTHFHWVLNVFQCFVYFSHTMPTNAWTLSGCCFRSPWTSDDFCWTFLTPPPSTCLQFNRCITSQLIKWFSNFREFYYIQMEKYARQAINEGVTAVEELAVGRDTELFRALNMHYNKANDFEVGEETCRRNCQNVVFLQHCQKCVFEIFTTVLPWLKSDS